MDEFNIHEPRISNRPTNAEEKAAIFLIALDLAMKVAANGDYTPEELAEGVAGYCKLIAANPEVDIKQPEKFIEGLIRRKRSEQGQVEE